MIVVILPAIACIVVLIYIIGQTRRRDPAWERFREHFRERRRRSPEEPIDPSFQFEAPADQEKDRPPS